MLALIAFGAAGAPLCLRAQTPPLKRVGITIVGSTAPKDNFVEAFIARMKELGWAEGRNIEYLYAYARGEQSRYEAMVGELIAQKPDVLFTSSGGAAAVAKKLTRDIPIVFALPSNPEKGLVASLRKPGGNITGPSTREMELLGKRIEILREINPGLRRIAILVNPNAPTIAKAYVEGYERDARNSGIQLLRIEARSAEELRPAFDRMAREGVQAVLGTADPIHGSLRKEISEQAARLRLPAIFTIEAYVEAGGLASYGTDIADQFRRAAVYVDKILRGAKPADLPVEEPTHFHLALNLKAAREQGIRIPQSVLVRADRVSE